MRIKMKRFLGILLTLTLVLGLMPGMSLTALAAGTTITWDSILSNYGISTYMGPDGIVNHGTNSDQGISVSLVSGSEFGDGFDGDTIRGLGAGSLAFTSTVGDISKIVITAEDNVRAYGLGSGWAATESTLTWSGTASDVVTLSWSDMIRAYHISKIEFTIGSPENSVIITAGSNMTKTAGSGAESQTGLSGAMTAVVYTANEGYYFPTDYNVTAVNGISVTRNSYTQITVSGTPTADATIALTAPTAKTTPDAPTTASATDCTTVDNNDGKLTGVTTAMEYQKSGDTSWTAGTGSDITGLVPGTYYVRVKATDTANASANQELTIAGYVDSTYDVTITAGDNMTKTAGSGAASQTDLSGAITDVAYTANDGYYFPENYSVESVNGISVTRDSYTQITVSGTPTADAAITLTAPTAKMTPDAPTTATAVDCTTADNNDGKLTGVTTAMEYQKSGDTSWTAGTGSDITGLVPGTYYVRVKATDTANASGNQELMIAGYVAPTYDVTITVGDNMTKTEASGAASQTDLSGEMADVVYTANDGYYFPENYSVESVNGIAVTRDSYTQITVSGTPSADAAITLTAPTAKTTPDAPTIAEAVDCTTADNNDGKITGVTTAMEYQKSGDTSWTAGTGSDITGLIPGTYYVRVKATDTTNASGNQELTIAEYVAPTYDVTITAGDNMTKTEASGAASQTDLSGEMADVVYTANDGYYFPENYSVESVNGISVTRDSYTQITVSGTPSADAAITLTAPTAKTTPDAPTTATAVDCTTADNNDGKLTGVTTAMEYQKSGDTSWTAGTGSDITGLVPGTYYVRVKATDTTNASGNQELTIKGFISYTVTFKVVNGAWDDETTADKTVTLNGLESDTLKLAATDIPAVGSKASDGYKAGSWDVTPSADAEITENTTYTYTYAAKDSIGATVTFRVVNGAWNDGTSEDKTVELSGLEGETLKLTADQIPAVGSKPSDSYKAGSWDATPSAETAIADDVTYTYTYAAKDSIGATVTFRVVNGAWNDGTKADKTVTLSGLEGDALMLGADQIPTAGRKPNDGYETGSWDVAPSATKEITEDTMYFYYYVRTNDISSVVTFKVVNGSWNDGTTADKTVTLIGAEGSTLTLSETQIPEAGAKAADGYKEGSWNITPSTSDAIKSNTTYTYTYAKDDSKPEPEPEKETGIRLEEQEDGTVRYLKDGEWQKAYTGLVYTNDEFYYVEDGLWIADKYAFIDYEGYQFIVANGKLAPMNGLVMDPNSDNWYFCVEGQVADHTGLVMYNDEWFYIEHGVLDTDRDGLVEYNGGLFYLAAGRLIRDVNGLVMDPNSSDWYFIALGEVQVQYTGLVCYNDVWFYVEKGKLATDYTGEAEYAGQIYNIVNGMAQ